MKILDRKFNSEKEKRQFFYNEVSENKKSEFINGEIIIHFPPTKEHNDVMRNLVSLISTFVAKNEVGYVGIGYLLICLSENNYQPDLCFFKNEKSNAFKEGQSIFPAPNLVVEILSKSTKKNDYGIKFEDYLAHNVTEYWIIDPIKKVVELYRINTKKQYELILKSSTGIIQSEVITNFEIKIEAIFDETISFEELARIVNSK